MPPRIRGAGSIKDKGKPSQSRRTKVQDDERHQFNILSVMTNYRDNILRRKLVIGKVLLQNFCARQRLNTYTLFENIGWGPFISLELPQYPTLTRLFYAHLEFFSDHQFSSYVRNTKIIMSYHDFTTLFGLGQHEFGIYVGRGWPIFQGFDPVCALQQLCGDPTITETFKLNSSCLTVESRLIHNVVRMTIIPRAGGMNEVSTMQIFVIWCILNGKKLSLPYLIFHHMKMMLGLHKGGLPYSIALTRVFQHFRIPLGRETDNRALVKTDYYSLKTLRLMGLTRTNNSWIAEQQVLMDEEEDDADAIDNNETANEDGIDDESECAANQNDPSLTTMFKQILDGMSSMSSTMEEVCGQLGNINQKMTCMQSDIDEIKRGNYR